MSFKMNNNIRLMKNVNLFIIYSIKLISIMFVKLFI